jgi:hypothetical protein
MLFSLNNLYLDTADTVDVKNVTVEFDGGKESTKSTQVRIKWIDPPYPNGLVVLYEIELARVDVPFVS